MADYQTYKKIDGGDAVIANSLGPAQVSGFSTAVTCRMTFTNTNYWSSGNGGCCCCWTVPGKVLSVRFELQGSGGSGAGSRCCQSNQGIPGGSGGYAMKQLWSHKGCFTPGSTSYTICAGGSNRCSCCGCCHGRTGCGFCGCVTYVQGSGLNNFCANGGSYGRQKCGGWCYNCLYMAQCNQCMNEQIACSCGWDYAIAGVRSVYHANQYCHTEFRQMAAGASGPYGAPVSYGRDFCSRGPIRGCCNGHSLYPGGGGFTSSAQGSDCWGDWGQAGMVVVTTWS